MTTSQARTVTVTAQQSSTQVFYIYSDQINTAREITNAAGVKVWEADPDPFGANLPNESPAGQGVFSYNPRFPGQYYDRETGLHYNYFRDYDPQTGRYIQSDPIGLAGGINTYGYVGGKPTSQIDPSGLAAAGGAIGASLGGWVGAALTAETGPGMAIGIAVGRLVGRAVGSAIEDACFSNTKTCPPCNPPAGEKFNKVTHYTSHSQDPAKGSHGCQQKTGSPVHWHYSANRQNPTTCQCFLAEHEFGGCGVAPP